MTNQEIKDICTKYNIEKYIINPDGSIDVNGGVYLSNNGLTELPLNFNRVSGDFYCSNNQLTTLKGSPIYIGGYFWCYSNELTTLEGSPEHVGRDFYCSFNQLTSLKGYNLPYNKLYCDNKEKLIRKYKLKLIDKLLN